MKITRLIEGLRALVEATPSFHTDLDEPRVHSLERAVNLDQLELGRFQQGRYDRFDPSVLNKVERLLDEYARISTNLDDKGRRALDSKLRRIIEAATDSVKRLGYSKRDHDWPGKPWPAELAELDRRFRKIIQRARDVLSYDEF